MLDHIKLVFIFQRSDFVASLNKNLHRSFEDVIHTIDSRQEQIVDARKVDEKSCISGKLILHTYTKIKYKVIIPQDCKLS